jgi:predicted Zn-dependent protease
VRTEAPPPRRGGDHPAPVRPSKLDELLREAASARRDGHLAAARESLERANTLRPGDPRVDEAYGDLLLEVGNLKEASRRYRKAVNARATTTLWLKLSDTLAAQGDGSGACAALARASKMDPGDRVLRRRQSKYRCR